MTPTSPRAGLIAAAGISAGLLWIACSDSPSQGDDPGPLFGTVVSSTPAQVRDFVGKAGGGAAKLVYIDRTRTPQRLCYLDFSEDAPIVRVIAAAKEPEVPVISPDGGWVVYASGEGTEAGSTPTARSSVYLVRLAENASPVRVAGDSACEPRFRQERTAGRLTVIYSTLCPDLAWEGQGRTLQVEVDVSAPMPAVGTPSTLFAHGSYTGGLSQGARYLAGGGAHVALLDLSSGRTRPDTLSYNLIQSCNASISSSPLFPGALMYLNFPKASSPIVNGGKEWGEWQAILISNVEKKLVRGYMYPDVPLETDPPSFTRAKWHHPEWSNHPYFAAATLNADRYFKGGNGFVNTQLQERVYLLNLRDSSYLEVLRPDTVAYKGKSFGGFFWPWLWVEIPGDFSEDSAWLKPRG